MSMADKSGLVPHQEEGRSLDAESVLTASDAVGAAKIYAAVRARLMDVNQWHEVAGMASAGFQLTDGSGQPVRRPVREGDCIRIDIPGPGLQQGEGYDWVRVEEVAEHQDDQVSYAGFRVRPSDNPQKGGATAHFYTSASTSTFTVSLEGTTITVAIADRNLLVNNDLPAAADRIRNILVGGGGMLGFSKLQWQQLADQLIKK